MTIGQGAARASVLVEMQTLQRDVENSPNTRKNSMISTSKASNSHQTVYLVKR